MSNEVVSGSSEEVIPSFNSQDFFNNKLPAGLLKNKEDAAKVEGEYQINITGSRGGNWLITCRETEVSCVPTTKIDAETTITIDDNSFDKLMYSPQAYSMQLFFSGDMIIDGNQMSAMRLNRVFNFGK